MRSEMHGILLFRLQWFWNELTPISKMHTPLPPRSGYPKCLVHLDVLLNAQFLFAKKGQKGHTSENRQFTPWENHHQNFQRDNEQCWQKDVFSNLHPPQLLLKCITITAATLKLEQRDVQQHTTASFFSLRMGVPIQKSIRVQILVDLSQIPQNSRIRKSRLLLHFVARCWRARWQKLFSERKLPHNKPFWFGEWLPSSDAECKFLFWMNLPQRLSVLSFYLSFIERLAIVICGKQVEKKMAEVLHCTYHEGFPCQALCTSWW